MNRALAIVDIQRLIEETERLIGKSNPKLAREVKDALEEKILELMIKLAQGKT